MAQRRDIRASDAERERLVERLRDHMLEGRLTSEELDERVEAAWRSVTLGDLDAVARDLPPEPVAAPAPGPPVFVPAGQGPRRADDDGGGSSALTLAIVGLGLFVLSFGVFSPVSLPVSAAAWIGGARARKRAARPAYATTGMVLGAVGTALSAAVLALVVLLVAVGWDLL